MKAKDVKTIIKDGGNFKIELIEGSFIGGKVMVFDDDGIIVRVWLRNTHIDILPVEISNIEPLTQLDENNNKINIIGTELLTVQFSPKEIDEILKNYIVKKFNISIHNVNVSFLFNVDDEGLMVESDSNNNLLENVVVYVDKKL